MKAQITLDFLRGILFAYIASQAWGNLYFIFLGIAPLQPVQTIVPASLFIAPASLFLIYASLLLALLFRPFSSAKVVFISLLLLAMVEVVLVGLALALSHHPAFSFLQHSEIFSISNHAVPLLLSIGAAAIACILYRKQKLTSVSSK